MPAAVSSIRWSFWLPLLLQLGLLAAIPLSASSPATATVVVPVLPGARPQLAIASVEELQRLPGWDSLLRQTAPPNAMRPPTGTTLYAILQAPDIPDAPWSAIAVRRDPPELPDGYVALRGTVAGDRINYGIDLPSDVSTAAALALQVDGDGRVERIEILPDSPALD